MRKKAEPGEAADPTPALGRIDRYLLSLPERTLRSATAASAGLLRELGDVALPAAVRRTSLYRNMVRGDAALSDRDGGGGGGCVPRGGESRSGLRVAPGGGERHRAGRHPGVPGVAGLGDGGAGRCFGRRAPADPGDRRLPQRGGAARPRHRVRDGGPHPDGPRGCLRPGCRRREHTAAGRGRSAQRVERDSEARAQDSTLATSLRRASVGWMAGSAGRGRGAEALGCSSCRR